MFYSMFRSPRNQMFAKYKHFRGTMYICSVFSGYSVPWTAGFYAGTRPIWIVTGSWVDHDGFTSGIYEYQRGFELDADKGVSTAICQCWRVLYVG